MAFAAGAAVTAPAFGALGSIAFYAANPDGTTRRRSSFLSGPDSQREFIADDDPSDFSTFSSPPSLMYARIARRKSMPAPPLATAAVKPDHSLLEDPHLQVWRDRYKWGREYGMNFAHNDT
ncbi:hypothetical protein H4R18_002431 [Coemansia javaensis]|uniref:Uncharacterized protein n=1 Tax=Coemansia javaensis TaxID=2761396 RepID=A0A9W8HBW1_9FUNG|nr:hypothetical protein H4R18_002431 [Coemansia javaensis]